MGLCDWVWGFWSVCIYELAFVKARRVSQIYFVEVWVQKSIRSMILVHDCSMAQYKIKRDYWDRRYLWIWFLLTNWWFILLDLRKWSINVKNNLIFVISYSIVSIVVFPFILLLIDWPINKWLLNKFKKYPVWYIILWSTWFIWGLSYLIYTAILLYNWNW